MSLVRSAVFLLSALVVVSATTTKTVSCDTWDKCWTCADNSDSDNGGCSWDGNSCSESTTGTTDPTDCDTYPALFDDQAKCIADNTDACSSASSTDCCEELWQCFLAAIKDNEGDEMTTDSDTGKIVDANYDLYKAACELTCPDISCKASASAISVMMPLTVVLAFLTMRWA